jgi:hypothetical protein
MGKKVLRRVGLVLPDIIPGIPKRITRFFNRIYTSTISDNLVAQSRPRALLQPTLDSHVERLDSPCPNEFQENSLCLRFLLRDPAPVCCNKSHKAAFLQASGGAAIEDMYRQFP